MWRCSSVSDCTAEKTGNRKASLSESTVTMGEGTGASVRERERESRLSNRKKINIDILTSQQNSSRGFCWIFPWASKKKEKKMFKSGYKDTLPACLPFILKLGFFFLLYLASACV